MSDVSFSDRDSFTDIDINGELASAQRKTHTLPAEVDKHNSMDDLPLRKPRHEKYYHSGDMIEFMVSLPFLGDCILMRMVVR